MAISIQFSDTGTDYKVTTTVTQTACVPRADVAVDDFIIFCIAADSDITPTEIKLRDGVNEEEYTPTVVVSAVNTGNTSVCIGWAQIDALPTGSSDMDWHIGGLSSSDAKAASIYIVRDLDSSPFDKSNSGTGSGTTHLSGQTATLSQADELIIGAIGTEHKLSELAGSWTTGSGYVSGNELSDGIDTNGSAANQTIRSAAEIVSSTDAQSAAITSEDDCDWAACIATFKESGGAPPPEPESLLAMLGVG